MAGPAESPFDTTKLLRELGREYETINWAYFGSRLRPLPLLLHRDASVLGRFTADPRRIELSSTLVIEQTWGAVIEVLKHEMAHQFVHEVLQHHDEASHGPSFRRTCERLGIDPRASGLPSAVPERAPILVRIRKLLALAGSPNQHEAETAMRMAHRLMLRHNLQPSHAESHAHAYSFRHLGRAVGRTTEAESLLAGLLGEFFFVQPIWVSVFRVTDQKRVNILEVTGRPENLVMAEYVHGYLLHAAESLWRAHKAKHGIERNAERRAFLAGVMRGFADKLRSERTSAATAGLVWVSDPLADGYFKRRHPRVRTSSYASSEHSSAATHGREAGRELVLRRPISEGPGGRMHALPAAIEAKRRD
jgi:hypothetical protein